MRCLGFPVLVLLVLLSACASSSPGDGGPETQGPPTQDAQGDAAAPDALLPEVTADGSVPDGGPLPDLLPAGCIEDGLECGTLPADGSTLHCGNCPATEWCNGKQACVSALDCANGGFQVVEAWHDQPQPGPAAATLAPPYSLALRWKASNPASCTDCNRAVVVSSPGSPDGGQIACRDLGPVAACPAVSSGWIALTVPEPVPSVATDALFVSLLPPGQSCADDWESFAPGQSHQVVSVAVSLADPDTVCEADPCGAAGATCGLAEDGCGGVIPCGSCPADQVCDGGSCRVAAPCELDLFDVADLLLDGFKNLAEVAAGESFPVLFSWSLGSSTAHDEMGRQVVLGIEAKPGICLDLGEVDACPSWSNGIGSGLLTAPAVPGTYQVQAAAVAAQDCAQAMAAYAAADNRLTVGTVVATGSCGAVDCDQLGAACGLWEDGCGEILHCGQCGSGGLCQQGTCAATPACADDTFVPSLIDLGGQGATAAYAAWDAVSFALPYRLAAGTWCPACARQVVLGSGPVALACEETGKAAQCPNTTWSATGGIFTAPPVPGTYLLRAALIAEADCPSALAAFGQAPSVPVGLLTVEGGCSPWSCEAMDRECGDWGDGCGGFLHCGSCPEGFTCTAQGQCQSPCAEGIFQVSEVSINGSGTAASAAPGKNAPVSLSYAVGNPEDCADCPRFLVVGLEDAPGGCKELGTPPACPATAKGSFTTPVQAPAQAGSYGVYAITTGGADCADASAKYASSPYRKKLGTLHVTSGCQPKSCVAMGKDCGSWEDGCDFLLQCGSCAPGKLCDAMGQCYCSSADPYEPNNTPGAAYDLGDHTDKDGESKVTLNGAVHGEADWFRMGATDVQWAYMEPYVHLVPGLPQKFEVTVAYRCLDGLFPGTYNEKVTDHCTLATDVSLPGVGVAETAWICTSTAGEEVVLHFGPHCATMNDSGELYVGVSSNGPCSSYELDLHL